MMDKYLKIFGLDNNFSLDELEGKYKKLLKEFDTKNIEDDLKVVFLEEQVRIREAYQALLKHCHERKKVSSREPKEKTLPVKAGKGGKKKNKILLIIAICLLLILVVLGFVFKDNIENLFGGSDINKEKEETTEEEDTSTCQVIFENGEFTSQDSVIIEDGDKLLECFKNKDGWIKIKDKKYRLFGDHAIKIEKEKDDWKIVKVGGLEKLEETLLQGNNDSKKVSKKIRVTIREIINWKMLTSEVGLSGNRNTWQWKNHVLKNKLNSNPESNFEESIKFITGKKNGNRDFISIEDLINFLENKEPIPTSKLIKIKRYIYETTESDEVKDYLNSLKNKEKDKEKEEEKVKGCKNKNYNEYNPDADIEDKSLCKTKKKCKTCKKDKDKCSGHSKCGVCKEKEEDCSCTICKDGVNFDKYPQTNKLAEKEIDNQKKIEEKKQEISTAEQNITAQEEMINSPKGAKIEDLVAKLKTFQNTLRTLKKELQKLEKKSECKKIQRWKSAFENCIKNNCRKGKQRYNNLKKAPCN